ncbi:hypothetical protein MTR67_001504 [Solanum verrucosum]|uniref:Uncharacterized protein n=1 Tax=Solanum verrucosum TaxID=315347 RepID=A0AAF0PUD9_SOLVR|nr:hypothetical protein MTR67_001504 [Solanum verrucosum]
MSEPPANRTTSSNFAYTEPLEWSIEHITVCPSCARYLKVSITCSS